MLQPVSHSRGSSHRTFGAWMAGVAAVAAVVAGRKGHLGPAGALAGLGLVLGVLAVLAPAALGPLNRGWTRLSLLLGKVTSPVVLGALFLLVVTPIGLLGRLFGRDPLRLKRRAAGSSWVERVPPGPAPESFRNPF